MIKQLNPSIPLICPKGKGQAMLVIDPGLEHDLLWVIAIDDTGEIWTFKNSEVRAQKNITMGRRSISDFDTIKNNLIDIKGY